MGSENVAISLFDPVDGNPLQNQEEEENIEEIRQRQQEIQNFLTAALDDYDDSTATSADDGNASIVRYTENDDRQLQTLYEMRCKEVLELTRERAALRERLAQIENGDAINRNLLEQCHVSVQQLQEALVRKTERAKEYRDKLKETEEMMESNHDVIKELREQNDLLRKENNRLNGKLNEVETMKHSARTTGQMESQQKISELGKELDEYCHTNKMLEAENTKLKNDILAAIREKNYISQENDRITRHLRSCIEEAQSQKLTLLNELQNVKEEYQRYKDETNTMKQTFEKIKEQIAPTRLQEIDTTISNLRRLLKEKDKEITELSRTARLKSVKDTGVMTDAVTNHVGLSLQAVKKSSTALHDSVKNLKVQFCKDLEEIKHHMASYVRCDMEKLENEKEILSSMLAALRDRLEQKHVSDKATNTEQSCSSFSLEKQEEIRKKLPPELENLEKKYASNCELLKTKLEKYKVLYEKSRNELSEFMTISNDHLKSLEAKVSAVKKAKGQMAEHVQLHKELLKEKDVQINELARLVKNQRMGAGALKRQLVLEEFKDVIALNKKIDMIKDGADSLVAGIESEYNKRTKALK